MAFSKYKHETLVSTFEALIRQQEGELWETYIHNSRRQYISQSRIGGGLHLKLMVHIFVRIISNTVFYPLKNELNPQNWKANFVVVHL